jgi:hypothetical protein
MLDIILEAFTEEEILKADGFDDAIIGIDYHSIRLIYSCRMALDILVKEGMSEYDAIEHFEYNVINSYVGEKTPIWCVDNL